jgi:hypothetical protein
MTNQSFRRKLEKLEAALYASGDRLTDSDIPVLNRAIARTDTQALKHMHGALVRGVFGSGEHINLVDLPYELTPEEVEAFGHLREALEEELDAT